MNTQDARTLLPAAHEQLLKQAIRFTQKGMSFVAIAAIVAVHRNTVAKWWRTYEREGAKGLRAQRRGRRVGEQRTLLGEQELAVQRLICDKTRINTNSPLRYGPVRRCRNSSRSV